MVEVGEDNGENSLTFPHCLPQRHLHETMEKTHEGGVWWGGVVQWGMIIVYSSLSHEVGVWTHNMIEGWARGEKNPSIFIVILTIFLKSIILNVPNH